MLVANMARYIDYVMRSRRFIVSTDQILTAFLELESPLIQTGWNVKRHPTMFFFDRALESLTRLQSR